MNAFRCLRAAARPAASAATLVRPQLSGAAQRSQTRHISLLSRRRPMLAASPFSPALLPPPGSSPASPTCAAETLDLAGKISTHPGLGSLQLRCGPRDTYNPSHLVRKRRHGFLSRLRTRKGRKTIMRRLNKGRWNISH
ncbi:hypothetical protein ACJQWK_10012 [Exserohilum turcicum]|uniref:Large ribosomal subunit protein bL34m n=1 Tax=Exserohilum turcicum (strain 28A) TaxID=671987 RepID=R0I4U3_EXST2|nr:uncharacterized protein SETTUDRAFT_157674 [Exserohilum turcica Et28A]EOA80675.1 hypothetical protein SETTUDRAFT_157674 [Exserohilum turcica Et28A]